MSEVAEQENDPQIGNQNEEEEEESAEKKETFQWNTPADEFAEDVASDLEDSEDEGGDAGRRGDGSQSQSIEFSHEVTNGQIDLGEKPKKAKPKHQFPCPKCNKIWNWPWELRRHLVMHFKEVHTLEVIMIATPSIFRCKHQHFIPMVWKSVVDVHLSSIGN